MNEYDYLSILYFANDTKDGNSANMRSTCMCSSV